VGGGGEWQVEAEAVGTRACRLAEAAPAQNTAVEGRGAHLDVVETACIVIMEMELLRPPARRSSSK
jgi:hypothetical protein